MTENWLHTKDGSDIYYRVVGQGQPIVFLHGNSLSSRYFDKQIAYFSKYYQVIVMDS
ncbi:alpha/beta hydrolase, partial [Streptococcus agalactiae]|nr:alpha/beta hydrolase [Streptococcus agalactiae]